jgi:hypothetical protein
VTDASAIQEQLALQHSLRLQNTVNSEERILNLFNLSIPENAEPVVNYSFGVLILSLLIFYSILNAFLSIFFFTYFK